MMKMKKVLVTELMWEDGINDLKQRGYDVYVDMELSRKREELLSLLPDYDAVIVRNESKVNTEFHDAAKKTKVIDCLGVGLNNIDLKVVRDRYIRVIYATNERVRVTV